MNRPDIETTVDGILSQVLGIPGDDVRHVDRATTNSWTSLAHVEILFSLQEDLGLRISDDEIAFAETRDDLVELAASYLQA